MLLSLSSYHNTYVLCGLLPLALAKNINHKQKWLPFRAYVIINHAMDRIILAVRVLICLLLHIPHFTQTSIALDKKVHQQIPCF